MTSKNNHIIRLSQPLIGDIEKEAVNSVLSSNMLAQGSRVELFEKNFSKECHSKYAVAVSSGTTALHVALMAHNIGPGDEVITTPFTFIATIHSIIHAGATPVFVDIEENTFNINPEQIEKVVTSRTRAILPVHLFGHPCDMNKINAIASRYKLVVIEDAAQALGAKFQNKKIGSLNTSCFSLYATKNITTGEGGMITTNNKKIADICRLLRNHGMRQRNDYQLVGFNYRMTDIAAAIGIQQVKKIKRFNSQRKKNAEFLSQHLETCITPSVSPNTSHAWHLYTIIFKDKKSRDRNHQQLAKKGVETNIFYNLPLHFLPHLKKYIKYSGNLPTATILANRVLSLPIHPSLTTKELWYIVDIVNSTQ